MNPVAIVTGASRGLGRAVATGLAQDGYELALVARGQAAVMAVSSDGMIASVSCVANCQAANPTSEVKIEDGHGGRDIFELKGLILAGHLSFSPDCTHLLIEYADFARLDFNGSAPERVMVIRV